MSGQFSDEIAANLERAESSINAAQELARNGHPDFAASRAYYAAFYAASALLLNEGLAFRRHSGVIATVHRRFVKTGRLDVTHGKNLNWLFELRSVGDYGVMMHISQQDAKSAIEAAGDFLDTVKSLLRENTE